MKKKTETQEELLARLRRKNGAPVGLTLDTAGRVVRCTVVFGVLGLFGCDDRPLGGPELRDAGVGLPPETEPDAGMPETDAGTVLSEDELEAALAESRARHDKVHQCCDCLDRALLVGDPCGISGGECQEPDRCFCTSEACTESQCGATSDLSEEAALNAECRCNNAECTEYVCGRKCLVGPEDACVGALDALGSITVRGRTSCLGACPVCAEVL
jgi:hypothetical protein